MLWVYRSQTREWSSVARFEYKGVDTSVREENFKAMRQNKYRFASDGKVHKENHVRSNLMSTSQAAFSG